MKKQILGAAVCILALSGCGGNKPNADLYGNNTHINANNSRAEVYNDKGKKPEKSEQFGYFRHQKSPVMGDRDDQRSHIAYLDRKQLAKNISRISTDLPNVNDAAVLVTDEEVLIAYETDTGNREMTADQVKRTAMSFVPRFFHVYVSDNKNLIRDVETLSSLSTQSNSAEESIASVIKEMKKSPQGRRISPSENENGETADDMEQGK